MHGAKNVVHSFAYKFRVSHGGSRSRTSEDGSATWTAEPSRFTRRRIFELHVQAPVAGDARLGGQDATLARQCNDAYTISLNSMTSRNGNTGRKGNTTCEDVRQRTQVPSIWCA